MKTSVKRIILVVDERTHRDLKAKKGDRTWEDFLLAKADNSSITDEWKARVLKKARDLHAATPREFLDLVLQELGL